MMFRSLALVMMVLGLVQSLGFYLDPIKQRAIKSPKDLEKSYTCFRYELENEVTIVEILSGGEIANQKLNVLVRDQNRNILRQKDNIRDQATKIFIKPEPQSLVDICFINIVHDASWSNLGVAREMDLNVRILDSNPKIDYKVKKDLEQQIKDADHKLVEDVERSLNKFEQDMDYLIKRESQLRDLNESVFAKTLYMLVGVSLCFALSQLVIFAILHRFARFAHCI